MTCSWWEGAAAVPDEERQLHATARQTELTKPPGSLGRLEEVAITLAALQGRERPDAERLAIHIFAADHGVVAEGVSAFPQAVTGQMLANFANGGAAINVLARCLNAHLRVFDLGLAAPVEPLAGVSQLNIAPGSTNFCSAPAMTDAHCNQALEAGRDALDAAVADGLDIYIAGEMGIGNTTSACALASALLTLAPRDLVGPGTGLDARGVERKLAVIERGLALHKQRTDAPFDALACLGGLEIAALTGAYVRAAQRGVPVLVDGYICSVAALCAVRLNATVRPWLLFGHRSAEPGHRHVLEALAAKPLLDIDMRLGEASGAAAAVPLLRLACALHNDMATFAEAAISSGSPA
ncbi:nicotinate-nucleotide--dimethylbenzimidazole phosphoribosyltransferase [Halopseudomonas nanhaiensis]|uniref:nicotinate-nucleotide--dimethylbenzimidazole phosphoribosyltransferase n=1 Tax=Halopseudomonas nanhaiensis TaxID=2830842 RepID=UPI001CBAE643|nr:nicotinate-nucleotide--dimethylbenzimidazole phosphoribosyltransferase [Halopseudomonas nanhaiensis]UAW97098.1 nicotinate-nucleotide--dimethylbenzimidazole phosphoribosyltransferase [Halopseudomonas nanhaiensis]